MAMPDPAPVPMMTPQTVLAPAPAPSMASETAKQLASFSMRTGRASASCRSRSRGRPLSHTVFAFLMTPVVGEMAPGMPTPTLAVCPRSASMPRTRSVTATIAAS